MPLSRSFNEFVKSRIERDPKFRQAMFREAVQTLIEGDVDTAKAVLRDYCRVGSERPEWRLTTPPARGNEGAMARKVHVFDNGGSVYDDHLIPAQRERYRRRNVHEAEEEDVFAELIRNLPPDGCYLNIGCAIGYYPLLAMRLLPALTIHAVEPLAQHRAFFAENVRLN